MKKMLILALSVLILSCGEEKKSIAIPENILSKEKMAQVITDIHLAEAQASLRSLPDTTSKGSISFQKIFDKDSISKQQYEESLSFYIEHPEMLDSVYAQVLNELSKMQGQAANGQ